MIEALKKISSKKVDFAIIGLLFVILYAFVFDPKLDLNGDNASYYLHGKGIAEGLGYVQYHVKGQPPAHHYPVGYPAIVAGVITTFGESIFAVKRFNGLFLLMSLFFVYDLIKRLTNKRSLALTTSLLLLFNPYLLRSSTIMMSEVPFLLFSTMALWLLSRIDWSKSIIHNRSWWLIIIVIGCSYLIRTSGVALVFGLSAFLIIRKNWTYLLSLIAGFSLFPIAWSIRNSLVGISSSSHMNQLMAVNPYDPSQGTIGASDLGVRFLENLSRYISLEINHGLFPFISVPWGGSAISAFVLGALFIASIIYGLYRLKKHRTLLLSYLAGSMGLLLLWPSIWSGPRFILPLFPILMLGFVNGVTQLANKAITLTHFKSVSPYWLLSLIVLFGAPLRDQVETSVANYPPEWESYFQTALWFRENTPKESTLVVCRKPELFSLYSNRFTARYRFETDADKQYQWMREKEVSHIVFAPMLSLSPVAKKMMNAVSQDQHYLGPMLEKYKDDINVISRIEQVDMWIIAL